MPDNEKTLTTAEYAKKAGLATSTVARMLRDGKLAAKNAAANGSFMPTRRKAAVRKKSNRPQRPPSGPAPISNNPPSSTTSYDIEAFSPIDFPDENGVRQWLKDGRLSGGTDSSGNLKVDASNLERAEFKHLVR